MPGGGCCFRVRLTKCPGGPGPGLWPLANALAEGCAPPEPLAGWCLRAGPGSPVGGGRRLACPSLSLSGRHLSLCCGLHPGPVRVQAWAQPVGPGRVQCPRSPARSFTGVDVQQLGPLGCCRVPQTLRAGCAGGHQNTGLPGGGCPALGVYGWNVPECQQSVSQPHLGGPQQCPWGKVRGPGKWLHPTRSVLICL